MNSLLGITVLFGIVATIVPGYFAWYFWRDGKERIGRVISFMLIGETISMAAAVWFAWHSYQEIYNTMSVYETMILRWIIFSTGLFSTIHLILYLIKKSEQVEVDNGRW